MRLAARTGTTIVVALALALAIVPGDASALSSPNLSVRAATLIEASTGQELYGQAAQTELPIASTTKLMTALLTLEKVRLGTVFADPDYYPAAADSQIGLVPGERMSVHDLLLALLLPSADDAAEDLAHNIGGSVGRFVGMMDARARELGLTHTHYSTPSGLDTPGNYSSASDLVQLARFLLATQPFFKRAVTLPSAVLRTGNHVRVVTNTNDLVGRVPWINGVKTGHTLQAGYVLVGSGTQDGMTLISAVLGTASESARDANTLALLNYGFANFRLVQPVTAGAVLARPDVSDRPGVHAVVVAASTFAHVIGRSTDVSTRIRVPRELAGPLRKGAVVGTLVVLAGGRTIASIPLLLAHALPAVSPLTVAGAFIARPFTLLMVALLLGAVVGAAMFRRERERAARAAGSTSA